MRETFAAARPFPHIVLDDILTDHGRRSLTTFPRPTWPGWSEFDDTYQRRKHVCANIDLIPPAFRDLIIECSQPRFLKFLEAVTGITSLITDPYLDGGGLHASGEGGILAPHTDFHLYQRLHLYRALNLLLYFNQGWTDKDGAALELFRKGEASPGAAIMPSFGRAVIFRTDDNSVHGFTTPVAPGKWRRSVALYYYTSREEGVFSGDTSTHWQAHGPRLGGARLALFDGLVFTSRAFSRLAHAINPNRRI